MHAARQQPCFELPGAPHTEGEWVDAGLGAPYRLRASLWQSIGSRVGAEAPQHYGRCDDVARSPRRHYRWEARSCALRPFDAEAVCSRLAGRQVVVVGDSTVLQTFLSLVLLLGGVFGKDVKHGMVICDLTAAACAGRVRLVFVRNDLLLWSTLSTGDFDRVRRCDGFSILHPFVQRASRDADLLVLGVGHHFPRSLMLAEKNARASRKPAETARRARIAFFSRNLNHTLSSVLARRAAWGRLDPSSVVLLGSTTPVRSCARYRRPLSLADAVAAHAAGGDEPEPPTANELRWQHYPRYNLVASWAAAATGVSFLDVAAPSARRPDAVMGPFWPAGSSRQRDCVHSCMPGPVDAWSMLLANLLESPRLVRALSELPPNAPAQQRAHGHAARRFFANYTRWLGVRGYSERLEKDECEPPVASKAPGMASKAAPMGRRERSSGPRCEAQPQLHRHSWWAFDCGRGRADHGANRSGAEWQPWMPVESFD